MKFIRLISIALLFAFSFAPTNASAADKAPLTPEFCEEGIQKAIDVINDMAQRINEIETEEQLKDLPAITNSIKMRNVRKKYGKIELTDEYRARLLEPNLKVRQALSDMVLRLRLPYQVQQILDQNASPEQIKQGIAESKTLRDIFDDAKM